MLAGNLGAKTETFLIAHPFDSARKINKSKNFSRTRGGGDKELTRHVLDKKNKLVFTKLGRPSGQGRYLPATRPRPGRQANAWWRDKFIRLGKLCKQIFLWGDDGQTQWRFPRDFAPAVLHY